MNRPNLDCQPTQHTSKVCDISVSHNGEYIASCAADGRLHISGLYETSENSSPRYLRGVKVNSVALNPHFSHANSKSRAVVIATCNITLYERGIRGYNDTVIYSQPDEIEQVRWYGNIIAWISYAGVRLYDSRRKQRFGFIQSSRVSDSTSALQRSTRLNCGLWWKATDVLLCYWPKVFKECSISSRRTPQVAGRPNGDDSVSIRSSVAESVRTMNGGNMSVRSGSHSSAFDAGSVVNGSKPVSSHHFQVSTSKSVVIHNNEYKNACLTICGIAPYHQHPDDVELMVVLAYDEDPGIVGDDRLLIIILRMSREDVAFEEVSRESVPVRNPDGTLQPTEVSLEYAHDDNVYYIVTPRDVICARPFDEDDRIDWLIKQDDYAKAAALVARIASNVGPRRHTVNSVQLLHAQQLVRAGQFAQAASECYKLCAREPSKWPEMARFFESHNALRYLGQYVPAHGGEYRHPLGEIIQCSYFTPHIFRVCLDHPLENVWYEQILCDFLNHSEYAEFLRFIKLWSSDRYNTKTIIATLYALTEFNVSRPPELLQALAYLYCHTAQYENALNIMLQTKDIAVFELIRANKLHRYVVQHRLVRDLFDIDASEAVMDEFATKLDECPVDAVVAQLSEVPQHALQYLDRLSVRNHQHHDAGRAHYNLQVRLYAKYEPKKLLHFLKHAVGYDMAEALSECKRHQLIDEQIYLLGRMGSANEALDIILTHLKEIDRAIEFCKDYNDEDLWALLIDRSVNNPDFIRVLLTTTGTHASPIVLIQRIEHGLKIDGLRDALAQMLRDYKLQKGLLEGVKNVFVTDSRQLLERKAAMRRRGVAVSSSGKCHFCKVRQDNAAGLVSHSNGGGRVGGRDGGGSSSYDVEVESVTRVFRRTLSVLQAPFAASSSSPALATGSGSRSSSTVQAEATRSFSDVRVYNCRHVFHDDCCCARANAANSTTSADFCVLCGLAADRVGSGVR